MTDINAQADLVTGDLRRAAIAGAAGDAPDRAPGVLVDAGGQTGADRFVPSTAPLAVAIDGAGLFVLEDDGRTIYSRLGAFHLDDSGRLVDGNGRTVMGFTRRNGVRSQVPEAIRVDQADVQAKRFASFKIDEQGMLLGVEHRGGGRKHARSEIEVPIAQLAIAGFSAPERLGRFGDNAFVATRAAGAPFYASPGSQGMGTLRSHVVSAGAIDLEGDLRKLWMLRRKGELDAAVAGASDACVRAALGLVR